MPLLEVEGSQGRTTARRRPCTASASPWRRAASPRCWAPTAPARPRRCARSAAWSPPKGRSASTASRIGGKADGGHRAPRRRPRAGRARHLHQSHGRGEPARRRLHAPRQGGGPARPGDGVRVLPDPEGPPRPAGRHAVGRRAADAGHQPRPDAGPAPAAARRALVRAGAAGRAGDLPHHAPHQQPRPR